MSRVVCTCTPHKSLYSLSAVHRNHTFNESAIYAAPLAVAQQRKRCMISNTYEYGRINKLLQTIIEHQWKLAPEKKNNTRIKAIYQNVRAAHRYMCVCVSVSLLFFFQSDNLSFKTEHNDKTH